MMKLMRSKYFTGLLLLVGAFCISPVKTYSQDEIPKELYASSGIPDSLKADANSVVRYSSEDITVSSPGTVVRKFHSLVTILNEKGDDEAIVELPYNKKFYNISDIDIRIYNPDGDLIKKYHKSDMYDGAAMESDILVSDDRLLYLKPTVATYPTTIEVAYEEDFSSFLQWGWDIQDDQQSVQNELFKVSADPQIGFRYISKNFALNPDKKTENGLDTYTWAVKNKKAIKLEDGAMAWRVLPKVYCAFNKFKYYGYSGDFSTWQNFGKWQQDLNADGCSLSPQRVAEIQQMTANLKTDKEKAKFLYEYMQHNMRYVAIALGIGGFKPFSADFVDQKKYGDCKAFSNYMCALLKAVNIKAYYAIVNAGPNEEPDDPSFPYDISDHIIVCVPFKNDTTWLECTSSIQPFGLLGSFTENRNALLITEDGGKLVNTPKSIASENQLNSEVHLVIDSTGGATAQVKILGTGVYRTDYVVYLTRLKADEQKQSLLSTLNIRQPSVFDFTLGADNDGVKEVDLNLQYDKFCDIIAGDKQFYRPKVFDLCAFTVPILDKRTSDYFFDQPMQKSCVTTIDLPTGFVVETLPANQSLKFTYGNYEINYVYDAVKNQVISTAKFTITNQDIPAAKYTELQQYLDAVAKAQNKKLVIHHKA